MANFLEVFKTIFEKIGNFFDIFDLSFFVAGVICLGALATEVHLVERADLANLKTRFEEETRSAQRDLSGGEKRRDILQAVMQPPGNSVSVPPDRLHGNQPNWLASVARVDVSTRLLSNTATRRTPSAMMRSTSSSGIRCISFCNTQFTTDSSFTLEPWAEQTPDAQWSPIRA